MKRTDLRNIAIIAHVDHGKTTLVDEMLRQGGIYRENQETTDRVMDSNDLERERGITILAKNTAIHYKDVKINVVDTPGHADFGGEVERILKMVNGVILLVDAAEGPMPQTRFVLERALAMNHRVIVVVNKIDRPDARLDEIGDEVLELLLELNATNEQLDSPMLFCSGRAGTASFDPHTPGTDLKPLLDTIIEYMPAPEGEEEEPLQLLVSAIDYNEFVGRIGIGRIERGMIKHLLPRQAEAHRHGLRHCLTGGSRRRHCRGDGNQGYVRGKSQNHVRMPGADRRQSARYLQGRYSRKLIIKAFSVMTEKY